MLHLWTQTRIRFVRFGRSFLYTILHFSIFQHLLLQLASIAASSDTVNQRNTDTPRLHWDIWSAVYFHTDHKWFPAGQSSVKIRQKLVHLCRVTFASIGSGRLAQCLFSSSVIVPFVALVLCSIPCNVFCLAEAAPVGPSQRPMPKHQSGTEFGTHDSLRLSGFRAPPPKVLMPPFDLGFKGQTESDTRKPSLSNSIDYQSDAASNERAGASSIKRSEANRNFAVPRGSYAGLQDEQVFFPGDNRKTNRYNNPMKIDDLKPAGYSDQATSRQTEWNPYRYPANTAKSPAAYYVDYQPISNDRSYALPQNPSYGNVPNPSPYEKNVRQTNPFERSYIQWEPAGYNSMNPTQSGQNQPVMAFYPYVRYDVGPGGVAEPYGRWETHMSYYQPAAQSYWNPYSPSPTGWFVPQMQGVHPSFQRSSSIHVVQPNVERPAEMRPTSVIGHPSNYREISREEMSQRVREYEQGRQVPVNGEFGLHHLTNEENTASSKEVMNSGSPIHDNGLFLTGNRAHDTHVRNFVNIAAEWSPVGVDALFDEIDLNGDGVIRLEELRKFLRLHEAHVPR